MRESTCELKQKQYIAEFHGSPGITIFHRCKILQKEILQLLIGALEKWALHAEKLPSYLRDY